MSVDEGRDSGVLYPLIRRNVSTLSQRVCNTLAVAHRHLSVS